MNQLSKPVVFTEEERLELSTSVMSMIMKLDKDKHVSDETKLLWWSMFNKLRKAAHDY